MGDSLGPLLWACLTFTVPLTLLSFVLGLLLGLASLCTLVLLPNLDLALQVAGRTAAPMLAIVPLGTLFLGYIGEVLARVLPRYATPLRSVR